MSFSVSRTSEVMLEMLREKSLFVHPWHQTPDETFLDSVRLAPSPICFQLSRGEIGSGPTRGPQLLFTQSSEKLRPAPHPEPDLEHHRQRTPHNMCVHVWSKRTTNELQIIRGGDCRWQHESVQLRQNRMIWRTWSMWVQFHPEASEVGLSYSKGGWNLIWFIRMTGR